MSRVASHLSLLPRLLVFLVAWYAPGFTTTADAPPTCTSTTGLIPLAELEGRTYKGFAGGLYPDAKNTPPSEHLARGRKQSSLIRPLDVRGRPTPVGKVVLLALGMSSAFAEFEAFREWVAQDPELNPAVVPINGAAGGKPAAKASDPNDDYWRTVGRRLREEGLTPEQVQVVWLKTADARVESPFPEHARILEAELLQILQIAKAKFPNLRVAYLSSRIYAGYTTRPLSPEPIAYETGFAVKWLIERQIAGDPALGLDRVPWLAWGPYLWADGLSRRRDGLRWTCEDFRDDRTHPSAPGAEKVAYLLSRFFETDALTQNWFRGRGGEIWTRSESALVRHAIAIIGDGASGIGKCAKS